jgi:starch synthase
VRVLMVTPEATPFAQTGGLGEVMSALPAELAGMGAEVDVLMPMYRGISPDRIPMEPLNVEVSLTLNVKEHRGSIWQHTTPRGVNYLFLRCDEYYDREGLYGTADRDYEDNSERFVFLARAAIETALVRKLHYDVFHCHDWQAALVPVYLRTLYAGETLLETAAAVMTIHNLGYQGIFWHLDMPLVGVGWEYFTPAHMEYFGRLNFLKSGIVFSDEVNTVSPGYRNEVLTPEFGFGLEGVLQNKGEHFTGILNGVDYTVWNPAVDRYLAAAYAPADLSGKAECKADLQRISGFPERPDAPLVAMVSRLSGQKGIDLFAAVLPMLREADAQIVLLGTGETLYHEMFRQAAEEAPDRVKFFFKYDMQLAHKIFAGSDIMAVPSRYEPCGLNQLYALKYGTVPVVRATGGLIDTVDEYNRDADSGTGFRFDQPDVTQLEAALARALAVFREDRDAWRRLMVRCMECDLSWTRSASAYLGLYKKALDGRAGWLRGADIR